MHSMSSAHRPCSTREHQQIDTQGIHTKICKLLATVRAPADEIGSEEDREKRNKAMKANQRKLLEITRDEASKYLVAGEFELAVRESALEADWCYQICKDSHFSFRRFLVRCKPSDSPWLCTARATLIWCPRICCLRKRTLVRTALSCFLM